MSEATAWTLDIPQIFRISIDTCHTEMGGQARNSTQWGKLNFRRCWRHSAEAKLS